MSQIFTTMFVFTFIFSQAQAFDFSHSAFTSVLQQHVVFEGSASKVNYQELKNNADGLRSYLGQLEAATEQEFLSWGKNQQYVFWVNAYNAYTLKLIIDNYPVKSIKNVVVLGSPWKKKFFTLLGKKRHLDNIEHDILRKKFSRPRTHFALNCASIGCPALLNEAYTTDKLEEQLERQAQLFIRDASRNRIDGKTLLLSQIFEWFEEDFTKNGQTVQKFVAPYMSDDPAVRAKLENGEFEVDYIDYDWGLNDTSPL